MILYVTMSVVSTTIKTEELGTELLKKLSFEG
jgi:hypothetical protein